MKITGMRVNHQQNPLGYHMEGATTFHWTVEDTPSKRQAAARVLVAADKAFTVVCYDTGEKAYLSGIGTPLEIPLSPRARYYWKVWVRGDTGDEAWSEPAWFETAKMGEPWQAKWIESPLGADIHPAMQHRFEMRGDIRSARAYVCGLGLYELYVNGSKVGDELLAPFCTSYDNWVQYQTYDVTELLTAGGNAVGVLLGNGWYKGRFGFDDGADCLYGDRFRLRLELHILYADGAEQVVATGEGWQCAPGPVTASGIYLGEHYDANREIAGFSTVNCDMTGFVPVIAGEADIPLEARRSPPVRVTQRVGPAELLHTPAGERVLDFGQVLTGWVECDVDLPQNAQLYLQCAELLQNGNFYTENLRAAKQEYRYTSCGERRRVRPYFTFYGFRYVKVEGPDTVNPADFIACVIHSDLEFTGELTVENPKVQKLVSNALWGQRGNFLDIPTDCPQRDERMGWTGDAQVFAATASFHMHTAAFFDKYLHDMQYEQRRYGGAVPHVVPDILRHIPSEFDNDTDKPAGSCAWGDAATVIPWTLYQFYGDKAALARHYPVMTAWVEYIRSRDRAAGDARLWRTGFHFADWLALDNPDKASRFGRTDPYFVASCYYCYSAGLTAKAAEALGYGEDAAEYGALADEVRAAVQREYFTADGRLTADTQTGHVIALFFDVAPPAFRQQTVERLRELLKAKDDHLDTGFVGTAYLCRVLSAVGLGELAYTLLLNEDYPSWLYEVNMGATTIWERWNSVLPDGLVSDTGMNSMNHYAYGAIVEWMYRCMCGLNPAKPGFAAARIAPRPDARIPSACARYRSAAGRYQSGWEQTPDGYRFAVEVPFDAQAVFVPPGDPLSVAVNGEQTDARGAIALAAGKHSITCTYA